MTFIIIIIVITIEWRDSLVVSVLDREIGVPVPLAAGGRVAAVGQLLFAP